MTERPWKFSQIISLSFIALLLAAGIAGTMSPGDPLLSDEAVAPIASRDAL